MKSECRRAALVPAQAGEGLGGQIIATVLSKITFAPKGMVEGSSPEDMLARAEYLLEVRGALTDGFLQDDALFNSTTVQEVMDVGCIGRARAAACRSQPTGGWVRTWRQQRLRRAGDAYRILITFYFPFFSPMVMCV